MPDLRFEGCLPFSSIRGVVTNNSATQALRIGTPWRKTSFGHRGVQGEVATACLLTVRQTCRMQGRNALDYLRVAIVCHRRRQPHPPFCQDISEGDLYCYLWRYFLTFSKAIRVFATIQRASCLV